MQIIESDSEAIDKFSQFVNLVLLVPQDSYLDRTDLLKWGLKHASDLHSIIANSTESSSLHIKLDQITGRIDSILKQLN